MLTDSRMIVTDEAVNLVWDLSSEPVTLGGALVLRQEGEFLAKFNSKSNIRLQVIVKESNRPMVEKVAEIVFSSSSLPFQLMYSSSVEEGWPALSVRSRPDFSHYSFTRLIALYEERGVRPMLAWNQHYKGLAEIARSRFRGVLICVHLRYVPPFTLEESNADGAAWQTFFEKHAEAGLCDFLLVGDDDLPPSITLGKGVTRAVDLEMKLATQLALICMSDGFLGMASGICTAANLSEVPHVIFKHPAHHSEAMTIELGSSNSFPFADQSQQIWRREVDPVVLDLALDVISA